MAPLGIGRRLRRLRGPRDRIYVLALDHGASAGPLPGLEDPADLLRRLAGVPFTGIIAAPGMVPCLGASALADAGLVVHLSAGSALGQRPGAKVLISSVSRAVSSGADAVSVSVHFGNAQEDRMLADVRRVVDEATSFGLPVLAMAYAPAPPGDPSRDLVVAAHAVRAAAEVGAAIVQTNYLGSLDGVREIARGCPVPLVVAGGPRASPSESLPAFVRGAIRAGAAGVSVGRTIFQSVDPPGTARRIADAIFEPNARILAEVAP